MKNPTLLALCAVLIASGATAEAKSKSKHSKHSDHDRYEEVKHKDRHYESHDRTRTIYVIERERPVSRVVYVSPGGGYYRYVDGRRVSIRGRYYTSYPARYYYPDGRRRVNVSFSF